MLLRSLMLLAPLWSYSSAHNLETREIFPIYLRNGGDTDSYTPSQKPAFAGFSFDVTLKNSTPWILVGQPRAGEAGRTESPGALYYCNVTLTTEGNAIDSVLTTETNYAATTGSGYSNRTTGPENTRAPQVTSSYLRPTCHKLKVFETTNRQQRGVDHKTHADALGLSIGKLGDSDEYAVCTPLRQRVCSNNISYTPGACYYGNPLNDNWNFMNWKETACFEDTIEIIFVVDGSQSITLKNFEIVKQWLINVTKELIQTYGEAVRTEILQYADRDPSWKPVPIEDSKKFVIPYVLDDAYAMKQMEQKIRDMRYINGQTYTYYALERVMVEFDKSKYKDKSTKIVVVLTDGEANDAIFLKGWYNKNGNNVKSFAVGVGNSVKDKSLKTIANGNANYERVLKVGDFDALQEIVSNLTSEIASAAPTEGSSNLSEDNPQEDVGSPRIGTSISSSKKGDAYIGASGMYLSGGVVTQFNRSSDSMADTPAFSEVEAALPNRTKDSYMGYSVVTGFFDGPGSKEYVASGAPRYLLEGAVVVYDAIQGSSMFDNHVTIRAPSDGKQMIASYYGGCLLSVDVSGDGKDDLLVAAPLFVGENYDEGRVFVYMSQETNSPQAWGSDSFTPIQLSGDNSNGARFGTAMAHAGDINLDGYNDVVIGAPLADNGLGAVYIYLGRKSGITEKPSQKIHASTLTGPKLHYFGQSLQGNIDVDGNQYPDIFVGAPKSDALVILKSRPVVKVYSTIEYAAESLDVSDCIRKGYENCSTLTVCLSANGTSVEPMIGVRYTLTLDSDKTRDSERRLLFSKNLDTTLTITTNISIAHQYCAVEYLNMRRNVEFHPGVTATIDFSLSSAHQSLPFSSVLDPLLGRSNHLTEDGIEDGMEDGMQAIIGWKTGCVSESCRPDLDVSGELVLPPSSRNLPEKLTQGERVLLVKSKDEKLTVRVNLTNKGEHSFKTKLKVTYPSEVSLLPASKFKTNIPSITKCIEEEGVPEPEGDHSIQLFHYDSDEMMMTADSWCAFEFEVTTDKLGEKAILDMITVNVTAFTSSNSSLDVDILNNNWTDSVKIRYQSDLNLRMDHSIANVDFNYTTAAKNITSIEEIGESKNRVYFDFRITTGDGYSNVPFTVMTFTWPWLTQDKNPLLYLYKLECDANKGRASCTCDDTKVNPYNLTLPGGNSTGGLETLKPATSTINASELNCPDTFGMNHTCESVTCVARDLNDVDEVHFRASFRTWTSSIKFVESIRNDTTLGSLFQISSVNSTLVVNDKFEPIVKSETVYTEVRKFTPEQPGIEGSRLWIFYIIAAVMAAILILAIAAIILWKCGFFRSKSDDEMKRDAQDELEEQLNFGPESPCEKESCLSPNGQAAKDSGGEAAPHP